MYLSGKASKPLFTQLFGTLLAATYSLGCVANTISSEQVIKDITYLASDELQGRASFSPEIDQAAHYIAKRFSEIGLKPLNNNNFLQTFTVNQIIPETINVKLNGYEISAQNIALATTIEQLNWQKDNAKVHYVSKNDDLRSTLSELNQQGGQHIVIIHSAHAKLFKRYQAYFKRRLTKLALEHQGALVLVLSDESQVENYVVNASAKLTKKTLNNVVGVLPGKKNNDDIVLYSSHYDHLGVSQDGKQIYNGADDNASGTTAVINLAQYFAKTATNNRTLMFSAFTAEEIGGFGSKYFANQLNPDAVVAMINIEMIGKPSKFGAGTLWMTGMERSNLGTLLNNELHKVGKQIYQDPYPEQGLFYRSDNATLARLGVPAHSFSSVQLDTDQHYHKVSDDIDSLNLSSMHHIIESLATATLPLVSGEVTPSRIDKTQVRAKGKIY